MTINDYSFRPTSHIFNLSGAAGGLSALQFAPHPEAGDLTKTYPLLNTHLRRSSHSRRSRRRSPCYHCTLRRARCSSLSDSGTHSICTLTRTKSY